MSGIAKRALISSLIASTIASTITSTAAAAGPADRGHDTPTPRTTEATRTCGHVLSATTGPDSIPATVLLSDGLVHEQLRRYLRRSQGAGPEEAEDAAQEAAMRAVQRGIRSCCATTFCGWLRRTAQNALFDLRKKQRSTALPAEPEQLNAIVGPSAESRPGDVLAVREEVEALLAHHDLEAMTTKKKAQLGSAIGEHLTAGLRLRSRRITKPLRLLEDLVPALQELSKFE